VLADADEQPVREVTVKLYVVFAAGEMSAAEDKDSIDS
jgi:DNA-dependent RNA polymerase auxiliary subunit epsilon